jgi:DnaJ-class molecular chaperone
VNRSPDAERLFKEITEAYRVLTSPSLRADYDLMRHRAQQARTGSGRTHQQHAPATLAPCFFATTHAATPNDH